MEIPEYELEDFWTADPYEFALKIKNPFEQQQVITQLTKQARTLDKDINFPKLLDAYKKNLGKSVERKTEFTGQPLQLKTGEWTCDDDGVRRVVMGKIEVACEHPIMPIARLYAIEDGKAKVEIAYKLSDKDWATTVCDKKMLASNRSITDLSDCGIDATSNNAKALIDYFRNLEKLNGGILPEHRTTSRMGWVDEKNFVPYTSSVVFDTGASGNRDLLSQVHCSNAKKGEDRYMEAVKKVRSGKQIIPRIVLAASLASVLAQPCKALPFIVHLWGKTGKGKTVTLMLAASVWGPPCVGQYAKSCNATQVGLELLASALNNLPLILDELQTISDKKNFEDTIYELTEGVTRSRGNRTLDMPETKRWQNCTITSGEQPITTSSSGGGVVNRIIDLPCGGVDLYENPNELCDVIKECYGYLGKRFVDKLCHADVLEEARSMYKSVYSDLIRSHSDVPEKQAQSAALIITADYIATEYIFEDKYMLKPYDLLPFIASSEEVDVGKRGYDWLINWISSQRMHFFRPDEDFSEVRTEIYGLINPDNTVTIISSVFTKACNEAGFNPTMLKRWLKENNLSESSPNRLDKKLRVSGTVTSCIVVKTAETVEVPFVPAGDGEQVVW